MTVWILEIRQMSASMKAVGSYVMQIRRIPWRRLWLEQMQLVLVSTGFVCLENYEHLLATALQTQIAHDVYTYIARLGAHAHTTYRYLGVLYILVVS